MTEEQILKLFRTLFCISFSLSFILWILGNLGVFKQVDGYILTLLILIYWIFIISFIILVVYLSFIEKIRFWKIILFIVTSLMTPLSLWPFIVLLNKITKRIRFLKSDKNIEGLVSAKIPITDLAKPAPLFLVTVLVTGIPETADSKVSVMCEPSRDLSTGFGKELCFVLLNFYFELIAPGTRNPAWFDIMDIFYITLITGLDIETSSLLRFDLVPNLKTFDYRAIFTLSKYEEESLLYKSEVNNNANNYYFYMTLAGLVKYLLTNYTSSEEKKEFLEMYSSANNDFVSFAKSFQIK